MSASGPTLRPACVWSVSSGPLARLGLVVLLFLILPIAVDAYTLVLRSGRHVTVPADFKVTPAAVIYEASPGFTVTVWLSNVDFAATERANAEPAGSFSKRIEREPEAVKEARPPVQRVVTNKELEPSRLRREAQEEEYERTRRERGMPSKQELQRQVEEQDRRLSELARQVREERREAKLESLMSELAEARRELNELSLRLSQQAVVYAPPSYYPYSYAPPVQVITVFPFGRHGQFGRGGFGPWRAPHPWPGNIFPSPFTLSRNAGTPQQVLAPAMPLPHR